MACVQSSHSAPTSSAHTLSPQVKLIHCKGPHTNCLHMAGDVLVYLA